ncbi:MAG: metallophosphoesterase [Spirochaetota bacterium]|nr:metallophosphoesterase [Spirochaetota bacterium]
MKIIVLGDIQMNLDPVRYIRDDIINSDLVLLTGGITSRGGWIEAQKVIEIITLLNPNILAIMGSVDTPGVLSYLESRGISLHGRGKIVNNIGFYGVGGGNRTMFERPFEYSEKDINEFLERGYNHIKKCNFIIMLSHVAPYNSLLDTTAKNEHVGSRVIRSFIFKHPPKLLLSSQIHGGIHLDRLGTSILASPGPLNKGGYLIIDTDETDFLKVKKKT